MFFPWRVGGSFCFQLFLEQKISPPVKGEIEILICPSIRGRPLRIDGTQMPLSERSESVWAKAGTAVKRPKGRKAGAVLCRESSLEFKALGEKGCAL